MRFSGPSKRRREGASGRVPPMWAARPNPGPSPLWPPRYGPLGPPFFVPFLGGGPPPPDIQVCASSGVPVPGVFKKDKAKIVQFEWNGCTFYRYIPDKMNAAAAAAGRLEPTPPPPPLPPFSRPPRTYEWHQRAQSRRRKQHMFPPRTPVPAWAPGPNLPPERSGDGGNKQYGGGATAAMGNPSGCRPYRARDNPRIPRKESKTPASHMHLPPFLAATSSKSGTTTKTPSPPSHMQGPPRGAAFRSKDAASAPLPYAVRAAFGGAEGASPSLPKRAEQHSAPSIATSSANQATGGGGKSKFGGGAGAVAARRSQDGIPESDVHGAKPKKPSRVANMTFNKSTAERPVSGPALNKTFTRGPPFRNSPRVYSSTVLNKDAGGKQESRGGAAGEASKPVQSAFKVSPPKEQRPSRQERRMRYKAEMVGSNVVVTQEERSPEKTDGDKGATAAPQKASTITASQPHGGGKKAHDKSSAQKVKTSTPKAQTPAWRDFDSSVFRNQASAIMAETGPVDNGRSSVDACTQVAGSFAMNEQLDRFLTPGPQSSMRAGSDDAGELTSPSGDEWLGNSRSVSIQTHENEAPSQPQVEKGGSKSECQALMQQQVESRQSACREVHESKREGVICNGVAAQNFDKVEVNGLLDEALSEGEQNVSLASYLEEPPTSSSEIYLDSLVSNGTSTSSPREDTYRKSSCGANRKPNEDGPAMLLEEMNVFLKECSPIKAAVKRTEAPQAVSYPREASSSCPSSNALSRSPGGESVQPDTSSSALNSTSCSSLSKGDGFSDISEPRSPLAKDLKVPDSTSLASDVIVINFAEDTTTLREHLEGLAADYNARQEEDNPAGADGAGAEENYSGRLVADNNGNSNVLERHTGSSPTGSTAPVLQPTHVSPGDPKKLAQETRSAGGDFCDGASARERGESFTQEQPQDQRRSRGGALSERGDDPFPALNKGADAGGGSCAGSYQRKDAFCGKCGDYFGSPGSGDSQGVVRVCSCKMRRAGLRSRNVEMEEALKEEYRDPQLIPYFVEETVEYLLLDSDSEEYEDAKRRASVHFPGSRGKAGSEERSAASERYPENSTSWNKLKEGSEASAVTAGRCSSDATTAASRALMYDCPWWTYDQGSDGTSDLKGSSNKALASCDQISTSSAAIPEVSSRSAATLHPWSATLGVGAPGTSDAAAVGAEATAAVANNPWGPFLATAQAMVGPRMEAASGDHESADQVACRMARSDIDFSALYMEGQPRKPSLKQRWASVDVGATAAVGATRPSGVSAAMGSDRDSLSFYEFPMNEQHEVIPPQRQSLSMETLVGSNRIDVASTSSTGGGGEPPLTEVNVMPQSAEAIENKDSGAHSPNAQCCELELYGPLSKSGPPVCTVVVPPQSLAEDGARGDASFEGAVVAETPPDDLNSCGDKKAPDGKPMGKIRTKFRDFFWKHK